MIWLLPLLLFGAYAAASRTEDQALADAEQKRLREIKEMERKLAEEAARAAANKKQGEQFLAMKPVVASPELYELNGEHPRHL